MNPEGSECKNHNDPLNNLVNLESLVNNPADKEKYDKVLEMANMNDPV